MMGCDATKSVWMTIWLYWERLDARGIPERECQHDQAFFKMAKYKFVDGLLL